MHMQKSASKIRQLESQSGTDGHTRPIALPCLLTRWARTNKYQLSLTDPRNRTRAVDRGWRSPVINYSGRASELEGIINLVDQWLSSLSRCERPPWSSEVDNTFRYAEAKFSKSGVSDKVQEGSTVIFVDTWISLQHSVGLVEKSHNAIIPD